jgi:hypothetical protein
LHTAVHAPAFWVLVGLVWLLLLLLRVYYLRLSADFNDPFENNFQCSAKNERERRRRRKKREEALDSEKPVSGAERVSYIASRQKLCGITQHGGILKSFERAPAFFLFQTPPLSSTI